MSATAPDGALGNEATRLVLDSVGTADAAALRAIRQVVGAPIQEVARLVYQAPSELTTRLRPPAADEVAALLGGLGFHVRVTPPDVPFQAGVGELEVALVITDVGRLPAAIAEAAAFLGTDLVTARRMLCRAPAVVVSKVSQATVDAIRHRFGRIGIDVDVSRSVSARYYAVIAVDNPALRHAVRDVLDDVAAEAPVIETEPALTVADLTLSQARQLFERLQRTGARAVVCNRDLERFDVSLQQSPDTGDIRALLAEVGIPERVIPRLLGALPIVIQQNVDYRTMQALLDRVAALGGHAIALSHSFQRFAVVLRSIADPAGAVQALVTIGDVPEAEATAHVRQANGARVGTFTRTTALWLQHTLAQQGSDVGIDLT